MENDGRLFVIWARKELVRINEKGKPEKYGFRVESEKVTEDMIDEVVSMFKKRGYKILFIKPWRGYRVRASQIGNPFA